MSHGINDTPRERLIAQLDRLELRRVPGPERAGLLPCTDTHGLRVECYRCGAVIPLAAAYADPSGPAFLAYYCRGGCAEWRAQEIEGARS